MAPLDNLIHVNRKRRNDEITGHTCVLGGNSPPPTPLFFRHSIIPSSFSPLSVDERGLVPWKTMQKFDTQSCHDGGTMFREL